MRLLSILVCLGASLALAKEGGTQEEAVLASLARPEVFKTAFEQQKTIPGLKKGLRATGTLVYSRELGVIWRTETPRRSETVLPARRTSGNRIEAEASAIVAAILSGDLEGLRRHFEISVWSEGGISEVSLLPRSSSVRDVIARLTLRISEGAVRSVQIEEASGGAVDIRLGSPDASYRLTEAESAALKTASR